MSYLFGDSSPSSLSSNFIELLRDALDFSVHVLQCEARARRCGEETQKAQRAAEGEGARLRSLHRALVDAAERAPRGPAEAPTARSAAAILQAADEIIRNEEATVGAALDAEIARLAAMTAEERESCVRALEALVLRHDLPGSTRTLRLEVGSGRPYSARLEGRASYGVEWLVALEIPEAHLFSHAVRLEKIAPQVEVQAPETGGWIRKETRIRPQRLDRFYLTSFVGSARRSAMKVRTSADGTGTGYDVEVDQDGGGAKLFRVAEGEAGGRSAVDSPQEDVAKLVALHEALVAATADLAVARTRLLDAQVDGAPMKELQSPSVVVDRLVAAMAPIVREIAAHSLTPTELVLKRLVAGDRREEIFISKGALLEKLAPLPAAARERFAALGLSEAISLVPAARASVVPAPAQDDVVPPSPRSSARPDASQAALAPPPSVSGELETPPSEPLLLKSGPRPKAEPEVTVTVEERSA